MPKKNYWNEEDTDLLVLLKNKGKSYYEISLLLNRSISACQTQVHNIKMCVDRTSFKLKQNT